MSKTDKRRSKRFSSEEVILHCEWQDCTFVDDLMHNYVHHISEKHMSMLIEGSRHCYWRNCECDIDTLEELRRHIWYHAFHTKIKCYGRNLSVRNKLANCCLSSSGQNIIPELPEPFNCIWSDCQLVFENPEDFYRHLDSHAAAEAGAKANWICCVSGCNKEFPELSKLKDHLRSHTQEKVIACPTCGGTFASRSKFVEHIERQTQLSELDQSSVFSCDFCARKLPTKKLLQDHIRLHVNHYRCPYCDMTCPTPSALATHVSYRHCDDKPYSCKYCDYKCKRNNDLRKHLETHSVSSSFVCPDENCNFSGRSSSYKKHIRSVHQGEEPAKYACHLCSKVTKRGNYLTKHFKVKHNICLPSGHCRFRYHLHSDGYYRVQTGRLESVELSEALLCDNAVIRSQNGEVNIVQSVTGDINVLQAVAGNVDLLQTVATNVMQSVSGDASVLHASTSNVNVLQTLASDSALLQSSTMNVNLLQPPTDNSNNVQACTNHNSLNNSTSNSTANNANVNQTVTVNAGLLVNNSNESTLQASTNNADVSNVVAGTAHLLPTAVNNADLLQTAVNNSDLLPTAVNKADLLPTAINNADLLPTAINNVDLLPTAVNNADILQTAIDNANILQENSCNAVAGVKNSQSVSKESFQPIIINVIPPHVNQSSKIELINLNTSSCNLHSEIQLLGMDSSIDVDDPSFLEYFYE